MKVRSARLGKRKGSALVELAFVAVLLMLTIFGAFELCRMILVYTTLVNASRVGIRYAVVHGVTNTGTGFDGPSGPGNTTNIETIVSNFSQGSLLDTSKLNIAISYPDSGGATPANSPGFRVRVQISYPYDPFILLPLNVPLASVTEGIITY